MTAQPPGIRPSALRVATHSQRGALLCVGGGLTPLHRYSQRILQLQPTGQKMEWKKENVYENRWKEKKEQRKIIQ